ncbi:MAG: hypothetical protein LBQ40_01240, partial [Clostridiales bacterium]|nr:hypothetical protein [Clostridiales bacterium]
MPKNDRVAVLDVGSEKIRAAVAEKDGQHISVCGTGEAEYSGFYEGAWLDPSEIKAAVLSAVSRAESASGSGIKKLFVGVPAQFCYAECKESVLFFEKPRKISGDEIALLFKKGEKFPDDDAYANITVAPVYFLLADNKRIIEPRGAVSDKIKALVSYVRCKKTFIGEIESILNAAGIEAEFVSSVWAEIMYLFAPEQRDRYVLFADAGYIASEVALLRGDGILALNGFSLGGGHITADIADLFEISFGQAQRVKAFADITYRGGGDVIPLDEYPDEGILADELAMAVAARVE